MGLYDALPYILTLPLMDIVSFYLIIRTSTGKQKSGEPLESFPGRYRITI